MVNVVTIRGFPTLIQYVFKISIFETMRGKLAYHLSFFFLLKDIYNKACVLCVKQNSILVNLLLTIVRVFSYQLKLICKCGLDLVC